MFKAWIAGIIYFLIVISQNNIGAEASVGRLFVNY